MADLTHGDIHKLAALARLNLSDQEIDEYSRELSAILDYVTQLADVDVDGLAPTNQVTGLTNVMREDVTVDYGYSPADLLQIVPAKSGDLIKVKRMIG